MSTRSRPRHAPLSRMIWRVHSARGPAAIAVVRAHVIGHIWGSSLLPAWRAWSTMVTAPDADGRPTTLTAYASARMVVPVMF